MEHGYRMRVIEAVEEVNKNQKEIVFKKLQKIMPKGETLQDKIVAVLGLAFKPDTDDMREAPALIVIDKLLKRWCKGACF